MPEAIKEGGGAGDAAAPEDAVPPPVDLATDGAVEVKPPPATEPSLPVDQVQQQESSNKMEEVGETAPEIKEPPTEQSGSDKTTPSQPQMEEGKTSESNPKEMLEEMVTKGRALLTIKRDCYAASEVLSKACEKASEIFGELSEQCGDLYYLYGCSMLECGKSENNVLGESMKDKETEEGDDEDENDEDENNEAMEVDEPEGGGPSSEVGTSNGAVVKDANEGAEDVTKADEDEEDDDSSLKVAWEMFEMAKVAFTRLDNKEKLADTLLKLAEVGIESGHPSAMDDMLASLEIKQTLFPNKRVIPETHFNIGLAYSTFQMFDEAISHFEKSKSLLEDMVTNLQNLGDDESIKEAKEIKDVLPDLKDKIQEMVDSKRAKREEIQEVLRNGISGMSSAPKENGGFAAGSSSEADKPASNITHLIKRKRKLDEVTSDLPNKAVEEPKRKVKALEKEEDAESRVDEQKLTDSKDLVETKVTTTKAEPSSEVEPMETEEEPGNSPTEQTPQVTEKIESVQPIVSQVKPDTDQSDQKSSAVADKEEGLVSESGNVELKPETGVVKDSTIQVKELAKNEAQNSDVNKLEVVKKVPEGEALETVNKVKTSTLNENSESVSVEAKTETDTMETTVEEGNQTGSVETENEKKNTDVNKLETVKSSEEAAKKEESSSETRMEEDNQVTTTSSHKKSEGVHEQVSSGDSTNNCDVPKNNIEDKKELIMDSTSTTESRKDNDLSDSRKDPLEEGKSIPEGTAPIIAEEASKNKSSKPECSVVEESAELTGKSTDVKPKTGVLETETSAESSISGEKTEELSKDNVEHSETIIVEAKTENEAMETTISDEKGKTEKVEIADSKTTKPAEMETEVKEEVKESTTVKKTADKGVEEEVVGSSGITEMETNTEVTANVTESAIKVAGEAEAANKVSEAQSKDIHESMETSTELDKVTESVDMKVTTTTTSDDSSEVKTVSETNQIGSTTSEVKVEKNEVPEEEAVNSSSETNDQVKETGEADLKEEKMNIESSVEETNQSCDSKEQKTVDTSETSVEVTQKSCKEGDDLTVAGKTSKDPEPSQTSKNSSEQIKVTNGCSEASAKELKENLENVAPKEIISKDIEEPKSVIAE